MTDATPKNTHTPVSEHTPTPPTLSERLRADPTLSHKAARLLAADRIDMLTDTNEELAKVNEELVAAATKFLAFYNNDLAKSNPGFMGKLCLQDYAQWNEAMIELPAALRRARGEA